MLRKIDFERRRGGEQSAHADVIKECSPDGSKCFIVYSRCKPEEIDDVIGTEISLAEAGRYVLEWKVYKHDTPSGLTDRLLAAGFEPEPVESLMVLAVNKEVLAAFDCRLYEIRRIDDVEHLSDVAAISRDIGRTNVEEEFRSMALTLQKTPDQMTIYVAYINGEGVACGRVYFKQNSEFAELCGGRTKRAYRNRGLYTALVAARVRDAVERNRKYVCADALPTSEPILRKRGFEFVTDTQPFVYRPLSSKRALIQKVQPVRLKGANTR